MAATVEEILKHHNSPISQPEWIAERREPKHLEIVDYNPVWPETFAKLKALIVDALRSKALAVVHTGSTSIPNLPAKDVIDIDLTIKDTTNEAAYVPALQAVGFVFLLRNPTWHEHRYFIHDEPAANLHIFGPRSPELARHRIFRQWLIDHPEDRERYEEVKRGAMLETSQIEGGGTVNQYNLRKSAVIREIYDKAFRSLGYIQ